MNKNVIIPSSKKYLHLRIFVSQRDFKRANKFKWYITYRKGSYRIFRTSTIDGVRRTMYLPRFLLSIVDPKITVDHKDTDTLNNKRSNLRIATYQQNGCNKRKLNTTTTSRYKGVHIHNTHGYKYWRAQIRVNYKNISLGLFKTENEAAVAYNENAIKYHGEFARLNKITA